MLQDIDPSVISAITDGPADTPSRTSSVSRISDVLATAHLTTFSDLPELPEVPEHSTETQDREEVQLSTNSQEREEGEDHGHGRESAHQVGAVHGSLV